MRRAPILLLFLLSIGTIANGDGGACPATWTYQNIAAWGDDNPACACGRKQSPIDIRGAVDSPASELIPDYHNITAKVRNTSRTAQVDVVCCANGVWFKGTRYNLANVHFHAPGEHRFDGVPAKMEVHLVHETADHAKRLVIAVLVDSGMSSSPAIGEMMRELPAAQCQSSAHGITFHPSQIIPWVAGQRWWWTYDGSLTTPDCAQNVTWLIWGPRTHVSTPDLEKMRRIFGETARPPQTLNARVVKKEPPH